MPIAARPETWDCSLPLVSTRSSVELGAQPSQERFCRLVEERLVEKLTKLGIRTP
jgi:hypothetical protein